MTPYTCCAIYLALKRHFNSESYDFFKYGGKIKISTDAFERRKDRKMFERLSKHIEPQYVILSNLVYDSSAWVGKMASREGQEVYLKWKRVSQSLSYIFQNDLLKLDSDFNKNFKVVDNEYPLLYKLWVSNEISLETVVILDKIVGFMSYWDRSINDDVVYPDKSKLIKKYSGFVTDDVDKFKILLRKTF